MLHVHIRVHYHRMGHTCVLTSVINYYISALYCELNSKEKVPKLASCCRELSCGRAGYVSYGQDTTDVSE